nr:MND1-interacting protein 1-like [Quercus suber]
MAELENLRSKEVFLNLKRYLGMAVQATFRLEEAANSQSRALDSERDKCLEVVRTLKASEADLVKAKEDLKEMTRARDSTIKVGQEGAQRQAKDQTRLLLEAEEQLTIAKEQIAKLKKKATKAEGARNVAEFARNEALRAKEEADFGMVEAQASKEAAEEAAYAMGVAKTEAALKVQVPGVENVYFPPAIREAARSSFEAQVATEEVDTAPNEDALAATTSDEPTREADPPGVIETDKGPNEEAP